MPRFTPDQPDQPLMFDMKTEKQWHALYAQAGESSALALLRTRIEDLSDAHGVATRVLWSDVSDSMSIKEFWGNLGALEAAGEVIFQNNYQSVKSAA